MCKSSIHPLHRRATSLPAKLACAQAGCAACTEEVIRQNEPLIHVILRDQWHGRVPYEDLVQEGRIALWRAIQHYDARRGTPFGRYASVAIRRGI